MKIFENSLAYYTHFYLIRHKIYNIFGYYLDQMLVNCYKNSCHKIAEDISGDRIGFYICMKTLKSRLGKHFCVTRWTREITSVGIYKIGRSTCLSNVRLGKEAPLILCHQFS